MPCGDGYSLAEQERQCRTYCAMRGWTDVQVYADEGISAFKDAVSARPALAERVGACVGNEGD